MNIVCFILGLADVVNIVYHVMKMKPVTHLPEDSDDFLYAAIAILNIPVAVVLFYLGWHLSG